MAERPTTTEMALEDLDQASFGLALGTDILQARLATLMREAFPEDDSSTSICPTD